MFKPTPDAVYHKVSAFGAAAAVWAWDGSRACAPCSGMGLNWGWGGPQGALPWGGGIRLKRERGVRVGAGVACECRVGLATAAASSHSRGTGGRLSSTPFANPPQPQGCGVATFSKPFEAEAAMRALGEQHCWPAVLPPADHSCCCCRCTLPCLPTAAARCLRNACAAPPPAVC